MIFWRLNFIFLGKSTVYKALNLDPDRYSKNALEFLSRLMVVEALKPEQRLENIIADYDIIIMRFAKIIDSALLDNANRLKVIVCNATGVDHIDVAAAESRGITVLSLKGEVDFLRTVHATAELTWGLLLSLLRNIPQAHGQVVSGRWQRDNFFGCELHGKRLGILGFGRIGEKVASYAKVFGMSVYGYDNKPINYPSDVIVAPTLEDLVHHSDVLSVHIPYQKETHELITLEILNQLPRGAFVINTSRGMVINERDLLHALQLRTIGGAAVDVLVNEHKQNFLHNNPLIEYAKNHNNLLITPHIGGVTRESWEKTETFMAEKLCDWLYKNIDYKTGSW